MNRFLKHTSMAMMMMVISITSLYAQEKAKVFNLKKGQTLDFILLNNKPGNEALRKRYFELAFPIAFAAGYNRLPSFKIVGNPLKGNYHPGAIIPGMWNTFSSRESFLEQVLPVIPDFYQMRREIWSTFNVVYFDLQEDISFSVEGDKHYTITAIWLNDSATLNASVDKWQKQLKTSKGKDILLLSGGKSPAGYMYAPDVFILTEWDNEDAVSMQTSAMDAKAMRHIQQWKIN
ncbi:MAG: hypothetical protein AAFO69_03980 [Bacteroidota bacterium]